MIGALIFRKSDVNLVLRRITSKQWEVTMIRLILLSSLIAVGFAAEAAQTRNAQPPSTCTYSV